MDILYKKPVKLAFLDLSGGERGSNISTSTLKPQAEVLQSAVFEAICFA